VRAAGFETYLVPASTVVHPRSASGDIPRWKEKLRVRNAVYIHRLYRRRFPLRVASRLVQIAVRRKPYLLAPLWHGLRGDFSRNYLD
jgi:GT2 family glycosyltransferase